MAVVAPSVADILHQASVSHQPSSKPLHVRAVSQKEIMDPIYATVQRKQKVRNTPEDIQQNSLEAFYGGKTISNSAAFIIQRAFRAYRLRKKFSKLLSVALTEESNNDTEEINVDTGLPMKADSPAAPDNLDLLILQAAGLETFTSIVHKVAPSQRHIKARRQGAGGQQPHLRRSTSLRICDKRASKKANLVCKDDTYVQGGIPGHEEGPSPPPEPCPELRGHYDKPKFRKEQCPFWLIKNCPKKCLNSNKGHFHKFPHSTCLTILMWASMITCIYTKNPLRHYTLGATQVLLLCHLRSLIRKDRSKTTWSLKFQHWTQWTCLHLLTFRRPSIPPKVT